MEQDIVKLLFGDKLLLYFLFASGPFFSLLIFLFAYKLAHKYGGQLIEIQWKQEETLRKLSDTMIDIRRDTAEIKETTKDNNIKLHVIDEKTSVKRRTATRAS